MADVSMSRFKNRQRILEAVLYLSVTEESFSFPTIEQFVLSELVNGTISHVVGRAGEVTYANTGDVGVIYEQKLWDYYEHEMAKTPQNELFPALREIIDDLVKPEWVHPSGPDKPYINTNLYDHFKGRMGGGGICPVVNQSTFSLPHGTVIHVERKVLPSISPEWRGDLESIAKEMRIFIEEDLAHIKEKYHW